MHGGLALQNGVLYVGRHEQTAHVRPYDLDGAPLSDGFSFRGAQGAPALLAGLDVDDDHQVWIADSGGSAVRSFTLFGRATGGFQTPAEEHSDARGSLHGVCDLEVEERDGRLELLVGCGGWRRSAVQLFDATGALLGVLASEGEDAASFHGVRRVARKGAKIYVCEAAAARVQVFRDGRFEFLFRVPARHGARVEPAAIAPLADGRMVLACTGMEHGLLLLDAGGRIERVLARGGAAEGEVDDPFDVAVEEGSSERETRVAVIDRAAERVQVFTLEGRCAGALSRLPGEAR